MSYFFGAKVRFMKQYLKNVPDDLWYIIDQKLKEEEIASTKSKKKLLMKEIDFYVEKFIPETSRLDGEDWREPLHRRCNTCDKKMFVYWNYITSLTPELCLRHEIESDYNEKRFYNKLCQQLQPN